MIYLFIGELFIILILFIFILLLEYKIYPNKLTRNQLELFCILVNAKDQYTQSHSNHVAALCGLLYDHLPKEMKNTVNKKKLLKAAMLHDVGKIYISDSILNKVDKLTDEEYEAIKLHTQIGAKILERTTYKDIAPIVALHHERIDSKGYCGAKDTQIPIESKLISIADTFSSLTTDRVYRKGKTINEALKIIQDNAGTQLDEALVKYFLEIDIYSLVAVDTMLKGQYFIDDINNFK